MPLVCSPVIFCAAALGDDRRQALRDVLQMMADLESYCAAASEAEGTQPAKNYYVYAYSAFHLERDPRQGQREALSPVVRTAVFDSPESLQKARSRYQALRLQCQQRVGLQRYREFPYQDKSWTYSKREEAVAQADRIRRESYMKYWPEVLELAVNSQTASDRYFVFSYNELQIRAEWEDDEDENELTYRAAVRRQESRIFDDAEVVAAAEKLYADYIAAWKNVGDGRGETVGEIKSQVQPYSSFAEARDAQRKVLDAPSPLP
jgi:hypothetical protein